MDRVADQSIDHAAVPHVSLRHHPDVLQPLQNTVDGCLRDRLRAFSLLDKRLNLGNGLVFVPAGQGVQDQAPLERNALTLIPDLLEQLLDV